MSGIAVPPADVPERAFRRFTITVFGDADTTAAVPERVQILPPSAALKAPETVMQNGDPVPDAVGRTHVGVMLPWVVWTSYSSVPNPAVLCRLVNPEPTFTALAYPQVSIHRLVIRSPSTVVERAAAFIVCDDASGDV